MGHLAAGALDVDAEDAEGRQLLPLPCREHPQGIRSQSARFLVVTTMFCRVPILKTSCTQALVDKRVQELQCTFCRVADDAGVVHMRFQLAVALPPGVLV